VNERPNLTIASVFQWSNEELLPNATLAPSFPHPRQHDVGCMSLASQLCQLKNEHLLMAMSEKTYM
jgi:hypothetical protein